MKKIALLHAEIADDAPEDEKDTIVEVQGVGVTLSCLGYQTKPIPVSLNMSAALAELNSFKPDIVFNLVEGIDARGQLIHLAPAMLDAYGWAYTGSRTEALFLTSHKLLAKQTLRNAGLATPTWFTEADLANVTVALPENRYIIKSIWEHASIGMDDSALVDTNSPGELRQHLARRQAMRTGVCFAEAFVTGREFNLSMLADGNGGVQILPPAEICFDDFPEGKPKIVDYRAKWDEDSFEFQHTRRSFQFLPEDAPLLEELRQIARRCWDVFDLRGYARVDLRVDELGNPWILEVNANPCLAPDGGYYCSCSRIGLSVEQVIQRILSAN